MISFILNNKNQSFTGDKTTPLLWVIRDQFQLTGTKFGCGIGACGACTVHINGKASRSCMIPISQVKDKDITTIEGLSKNDVLTPVQQAWVDEDVPQCGYCQTGQIMAATDFLQQYPTPTDEQIKKELTNICRCGTYTRIRKAIHKAADLMAKERQNG